MIENFITHLRAQGKSENTLKSYLADLQKLASALPVSLGEAGPEHLDEYFAGADVAASTRNRMISSARGFFGWALKMGLIGQDPARDLRTRKLQTIPAGIISEFEYRVLLKHLLRRSDELAQRDHLAIRLMGEMGLRVSELCALNIEDVDLESKHLVVRGGKGGKDRLLFLSTDMRRILKRYFKTHDGDVIFPITSRAMQLRISYWTAEAGLRTHLTPHGLRHRFATQLLATSNLACVQKALGHSSITTTQVYLHVGDEDLRAAMGAMCRSRDISPKRNHQTRLSDPSSIPKTPSPPDALGPLCAFLPA